MSKGTEGWSFNQKLWLSLFVFWLLWLPLGLFAPEPVIASTFVCVIVGVAVPVLDRIW